MVGLAAIFTSGLLAVTLKLKIVPGAIPPVTVLQTFSTAGRYTKFVKSIDVIELRWIVVAVAYGFGSTPDGGLAMKLITNASVERILDTRTISGVIPAMVFRSAAVTLTSETRTGVP